MEPTGRGRRKGRKEIRWEEGKGKKEARGAVKENGDK